MSEPTMANENLAVAGCAICQREFVNKEIIHSAMTAWIFDMCHESPSLKVYICHECMTCPKEKP